MKPTLPALLMSLCACAMASPPQAAAPCTTAQVDSFDNASIGTATPAGWVAQPSTTGAWQVVAAPGFGHVWRLSGISFDRSGNASATRRLELATAQPWQLSSEFSLREFSASSKAGIARFGLGALGQRPLFANANGTEAAKYSFYLIDVRVSANDNPDYLTPVLRIVRFNDRGVATMLAAETQFSAMPISPGDRLRLTLNGSYDISGSIILKAQLINITRATTTPVVGAEDKAPLSGANFGYRHTDGRTGLTAFELWNDNFSLTPQP